MFLVGVTTLSMLFFVTLLGGHKGAPFLACATVAFMYFLLKTKTFEEPVEQNINRRMTGNATARMALRLTRFGQFCSFGIIALYVALIRWLYVQLDQECTEDTGIFSACHITLVLHNPGLLPFIAGYLGILLMTSIGLTYYSYIVSKKEKARRELEKRRPIVPNNVVVGTPVPNQKSAQAATTIAAAVRGMKGRQKAQQMTKSTANLASKTKPTVRGPLGVPVMKGQINKGFTNPNPNPNHIAKEKYKQEIKEKRNKRKEGAGFYRR